MICLTSRGIMTQIFNHTVTGKKGYTAEISAIFQGKLLTIDLRFPHEPELDKKFFSYLYSFDHPLQRGLNIRKGALNTFRAIYTRIHRNIFKTIWDENPEVDIGKELKRLLSFLEAIQDKLLAGLNPDYVKLCRKFPSSRMQYYRFLCDHDHPRVREMFQSCPGLISAIVVGKEKDIFKGRHLRYVVRMIRNGAKIRTILDFVFDHLLHDSYKTDHSFSLWQAIHSFCKNRWATIRTDWFWLTERAGYKVSGRVILMPPPAFLPKSHLPSRAVDRGNWYKRIRCFSVMMFPEVQREISTRQMNGFILMASNADKKFYKFFARKKTVAVEYLKHSGRVPRSGTCYRKFFQEAKAHQEIHQVPDERETDVRECFEVVKRLNKVQDCSWEYQDEKLVMRPLISWEDYLNESRLMSNCMRKLWYDGHKKKVIHFHVVCAGKDYSLEVSLPSIFPSQVKGFKNSEPPKELEEHLIDVITQHRSAIKDHLKGLGYEFPAVEGGNGKSYALQRISETAF